MFIKLDINILRLLAFANTLFTNNKDFLLQIEYILVLEAILYNFFFIVNILQVMIFKLTVIATLLK